MADIDFLVKNEDWDRSMELMVSAGFSLVQQFSRQATQQQFHEAGFLMPLENGEEILFEVHRQLVQPSRHPIDYQKLWSRTYPATFDNIPCRRMCDTDHFLHLAIHLFSHRFTGLKRTFRDLTLLVEKCDVEWDVLYPRADAWKCKKALWLTLILANQNHRDHRFDEIIRQCAPGFFNRQLLKLLVSPDEEFIFKKAGLRMEEAILWPLLMDDLSQGLEFIADFATLRLRDFLTR